MARPARVWYRKDIKCWMVIINGVREKLLYGPRDEHHRQLAEEEFMKRRRLARIAPESSSSRVHDLVEAFLDHSKLHFAFDTHRVNKYYCQLFDEACGLTLTRDMRPFHLDRWVNKKIAADEWGEWTVYCARKTACRVFSWAFACKIISENPLSGIRNPKPPPRQRALTAEEYAALYANAGAPLRDFMQALQLTGARPKEIRDLTWDMVLPDRWVIPKHKTRKKTGKPRVIYLDGTMQAMMERLRRPSSHVFLNTVGKPWTMSAMRQQIWRIKKKLNLADDVCAYLFRHWFGTRAILAGAGGIEVAEAMGHTSQDTISKVYVHLAGQHEHLSAVVAKINSSVPPTPSQAGHDSTRKRARPAPRPEPGPLAPSSEPSEESKGRRPGPRGQS